MLLCLLRYMVCIHDFSDEELLSRENEMALLMLINKIQRAEDFHQFLSLPQDKIELIVKMLRNKPWKS